MNNYYVLSHDSNRDDLEVVIDYEMGGFDLTKFWSGEKFQGSIPRDVRLWIAKGESSDYLGNPLSWPIISDRLWRLIRGLAQQCCQLVELPLYYKDTDKCAEGFSLMNVTCSVSAVKSEVSDLSISNLVLDESQIPPDMDIFRLAESSTVLVVSNALRELVSGKQLRGIALIELRSTRATS